MIVTKAAKQSLTGVKPEIDRQNSPRTEFVSSYGDPTASGERVSPEGSKGIATAYRAANIISDDVAKMPLQLMQRKAGKTTQVAPDPSRNLPYLVEISPNQWGWTPFQFKKATIQWLLFYGNAYMWKPLVTPQQLLILPADTTKPVFDLEGNLWYEARFSSGKTEYIPSVEILQLLINPDATGFVGRGVITYARETLGQQIGAHKTAAKFYSQGMNASGLLYIEGTIKDEDERDKYRRQFAGAISGSDNAYGVAVLDKRVTKFEPVSIHPRDAQFLEEIEATDRDIANFFGVPLHFLNMGKEAYNSNEQKYIEYLQGTLDAYLVQWEQGARIKWLTETEQSDHYFKFIRESLLRMDAKTRAETNEILIRSSQRSPNEAREKDDYSNHPGGDDFYMTANYVKLGAKPDAQPE